MLKKGWCNTIIILLTMLLAVVAFLYYWFYWRIRKWEKISIADYSYFQKGDLLEISGEVLVVKKVDVNDCSIFLERDLLKVET
jgi:preprotein translocase subunit YajC